MYPIVDFDASTAARCVDWLRLCEEAVGCAKLPTGRVVVVRGFSVRVEAEVEGRERRCAARRESVVDGPREEGREEVRDVGRELEEAGREEAEEAERLGSVTRRAALLVVLVCDSAAAGREVRVDVAVLVLGFRGAGAVRPFISARSCAVSASSSASAARKLASMSRWVLDRPSASRPDRKARWQPAM